VDLVLMATHHQVYESKVMNRGGKRGGLKAN